MISLHGDDSLPLRLESLGVPTVINGRPTSGDESIYYVDSDNLVGARIATELLIERGCRRIATITGPLDMGAGLDRLAGYHHALDRAGLEHDERLVAEGDFSVDGGVRAMSRILAAEPEVDGVFAASDLTAFGALSVLDAAGRRVPDDVAVVGFDDIREAAASQPPLSTIRQPLDDVARTLARTLLARINSDDPPRTSVVPVTLVRRGSA